MVSPIREDQVEFTAIRAQGPGGQNVNKVATAAHLRFNVAGSSLTAPVKERLLYLAGRRATKDGVVVIKAQSARTQDLNRAEALRRLNELLSLASEPVVPRRPTKPTYGSKLRRLEGKAERGAVKESRAKVRN